MKLCYRFPVVRGRQAGKEYYIGMVPLKMLRRIFMDDDEYVFPEYRAQRRLNETRIPEIKKYILDNKESYVFSALTASIDGDFEFIHSNIDDTGILEIALDARLLINDGQHRKAAIMAALEEDESIGDETISIVFFEDKGLSSSQQMFTDLNKHAVKTSNSISELYDSRDELAVVTRSVVSEVVFLNEYVDKERDILGKYSSALFTLNTFYNANKRILKRGDINSTFQEFLVDYWTGVCNHMTPWKELQSKELSKKDLREQYIATQAIIIQAFGKVGAQLYDEHLELEKYLSRLEAINWKRSWNGWKQRVIKHNGRIISNEQSISLAAILIKKTLGLHLNEEEINQEKAFMESIGYNNE